MFTIYGGNTEFNQWELNQKVTEPGLSVGDKVVFVNSNGFCYPMKAYMYGSEVVVDAPNALLTMTSPIVVYINGKYETRTSISVVAQERPKDYVFVDNAKWDSNGAVPSKHTMIDMTPYLATMESNEYVPVSAAVLDVFVEGFKNKNVVCYIPGESGDLDCGLFYPVVAYTKNIDQLDPSFTSINYGFTVLDASLTPMNLDVRVDNNGVPWVRMNIGGFDE